MPENKVRKYFNLIEAWAWCDICEDMISLNIDKKEIISGLEMGIYTKEYKHANPSPDLEDVDDISGQEHAIYVYINDNYVVVKEISPMAVQLGMLTKEQFKVLKICDGMNTIEQVASIAQKSEKDIEKMMEKLRKKGLVRVIIRT